MKPTDLLDYFAKAGHPVYLDGETLRLKGRPSPDLIDLARARKADLLAALAPKPDPRQALYRKWLEWVTEPRVLLTLEDQQVREAVAAGVVTPETAAASVLVLVKVPQGEAGPGACGLLAVPRAKYADFSPSAAVDALGSWH